MRRICVVWHLSTMGTSCGRFEKHSLYEQCSLVVYLVSTTLSLSALIGFFHTFEAELATAQIKRKLLLIKGVVGLCFWQKFAAPTLAAAYSAHVQSDPGAAPVSADDVNDVLVAAEMGLVFALVFAHVFQPQAEDGEGVGAGVGRRIKFD